MNEIFCIRCKNKKLDTLISGEFRCGDCRQIFGATQFKDYLLEKVEEVEKLGQLNACCRCGNMLSNPNWCAWCGSEPGYPEDVIRDLKEHIRVIDALIKAGEPVEFRKARAGNQEVITHVFDRAVYHDEWKPLIDLGPAALQFLIGKLTSSDLQKKSAAAKALIEIGNDCAVAPLIEAITLSGDDLNHVILSGLKLQWVRSLPQAFSLLLKKLDDVSLSGFSQPGELARTLQFDIVSGLERILEHAIGDISDNDLIAATKIRDVSVRLIRSDYSVTLHDEDPWGHVYYHPTCEVSETVDCSSLRQAAQLEMQRRGLE